MISQLILTTLMALGIATGSLGIKANNESGNVLNTSQENNKQKTKKAVVNNDYTLYSHVAQTYDDSNNKLWQYKYYLNASQSTTPTPTANCLLDPFLITNTYYSISSKNNNNYRVGHEYLILKFTNYTNSIQTIEFDTTIHYSTTRNVRSRTWIYESYDESLNDMIDLTLNASISGTLYNLMDNADLIQLSSLDETLTGQDIDKTVESPQITLNADETKYILMYTYDTCTATTENYGWITLNQMEIRGQYIQQNITQEIVDIPNLMYTVLTMPFSFISQAFNLTIFPNTPYALNFTNLFMTLLAIFILMWIIRKVFK